MKKNSTIITVIVVLVIVGLFAGKAYVSKRDTEVGFQKLQATIQGYSATTPARIDKAGITLPDGSIVGLLNGSQSYSTQETHGVVRINDKAIGTEFIPGLAGVTVPRLDAAAPMTVTGDNQGGSTYVLLFNDTGTVTKEMSYSRLGGLDTNVLNISMLPSDERDYEYKVDISYTQKGSSKEIIIPVLNGQFDPKGIVQVK